MADVTGAARPDGAPRSAATPAAVPAPKRRVIAQYLPPGVLDKYPIHELTGGARDVLLTEIPAEISDSDASHIASAISGVLPTATIRANAKNIGLQSEDQIKQYINTPIEQRSSTKEDITAFNKLPGWIGGPLRAGKKFLEALPGTRGLGTEEFKTAGDIAAQTQLPGVGRVVAQAISGHGLGHDVAPSSTSDKVFDFVGGTAGFLAGAAVATETAGAGAARLVGKFGRMPMPAPLAARGSAEAQRAANAAWQFARRQAIQKSVAAGAATGATIGLTQTPGSLKARAIAAASYAPWFALTGGVAAKMGPAKLAPAIKIPKWAEERLASIGVTRGVNVFLPTAGEAAKRGALLGAALGVGPVVTSHAIYAATGQPTDWPTATEWAQSVGSAALFGAMSGAKVQERLSGPPLDIPGRENPRLYPKPGPVKPLPPESGAWVVTSGAEVIEDPPAPTGPERQLTGPATPGEWFSDPALRTIYRAGARAIASETWTNPFDDHMTPLQSYTARFNAYMSDLSAAPEAKPGTTPKAGENIRGAREQHARIAATFARAETNARKMLWQNMQAEPPTGPPSIQRERVQLGERLTRRLTDVIGTNPVEINIGGAEFKGATVLEARVIPWSPYQVRLIVRDGATDRVVPLQFKTLEDFRNSMSETGRAAVSRTLGATYNQPGAPSLERGGVLPRPFEPRGLLGEGGQPEPPASPAPEAGPAAPAAPAAPVAASHAPEAAPDKPKPYAPSKETQERFFALKGVSMADKGKLTIRQKAALSKEWGEWLKSGGTNPVQRWDDGKKGGPGKKPPPPTAGGSPAKPKPKPKPSAPAGRAALAPTGKAKPDNYVYVASAPARKPGKFTKSPTPKSDLVGKYAVMKGGARNSGVVVRVVGHQDDDGVLELENNWGQKFNVLLKDVLELNDLKKIAEEGMRRARAGYKAKPAPKPVASKEPEPPAKGKKTEGAFSPEGDYDTGRGAGVAPAETGPHETIRSLMKSVLSDRPNLAMRSPGGTWWTNGHLLLKMDALKKLDDAEKFGAIADKNSGYPKVEAVIPKNNTVALEPVGLIHADKIGKVGKHSNGPLVVLAVKGTNTPFTVVKASYWNFLVKSIGGGISVFGSSGKQGSLKAITIMRRLPTHERSGRVALAAVLMPIRHELLSKIDVAAIRAEVAKQPTASPAPKKGHYYSKSAGRAVPIADMANGHLINAWRFLDLREGSTPSESRAELWDEITKRGLAEEALGDDSPSKQAVFKDLGKGGKLVGASMSDRTLEVLGANMYEGDPAKITVKEALQNAYDGARPMGENADLLLRVSNRHRHLIDRYFSMHDNGTGMSPETMEKELMDPGATLKPVGSSGGFGFAKIALFWSAKEITVYSRWKDDGGKLHDTLITGSGASWRSGEMEYIAGHPEGQRLDPSLETPGLSERAKKEIYDWFGESGEYTPGSIVSPLANAHETGTYLRLVYPSAEENPNLQFSSADRNDYLEDFLRVNRIRGSIRIEEEFYKETFDFEDWDLYKRTGSFSTGMSVTYDPFKVQDLELELAETSAAPGADVAILLPKQAKWKERYGTEVQVLNNGLPQLTMLARIGNDVAIMPEMIVFDISPNVPPTDGMYPFATNRESIKNDVKAVLDSFVRGMASSMANKEAAQMRVALHGATSFPGNPSIKIVDTSGDAGDGLVGAVAASSKIEALMERIVDAVKDLGVSAYSWDDSYIPEQYTFLGLGLMKDALGLNIKGHSAWWDGGGNIILLNPIWNAIEAIARAEADVEDIRDDSRPLMFRGHDDMVRWTANSIVVTAVHEIVHQKHRGHEKDFVGELGRLLAHPRMKETVAEWSDIIFKHMKENETFEELLTFRNRLLALSQGEGLFSKVGINSRVSDTARRRPGDQASPAGSKAGGGGRGAPVRSRASGGKKASPVDTREADRAALENELAGKSGKEKWLELADAGYFDGNKHALHVRDIYVKTFAGFKSPPDPRLVMDMAGRVFNRSAVTESWARRTVEVIEKEQKRAAVERKDTRDLARTVFSSRDDARKQLDWFKAEVAKHKASDLSDQQWADAMWDIGTDLNKKFGVVSPIDAGAHYMDALGTAGLADIAKRVIHAILADSAPKAMAKFLRASGKMLTSEYWFNHSRKVIRRRPIPFTTDPWTELSFYRAFGRRGVGGGGVVLPPAIRQQGYAAESEYSFRMGAAWDELYRILGTRGLKTFARGSYYGEQLFHYFDGKADADLPAWVRPKLDRIRTLFDTMWEKLTDRMRELGTSEEDLPKKLSDYIPHLIRGMGSEHFDRFFQQMYAGRRAMSAAEILEIRNRFLLNREGIKDYETDFMTSFRAYVRAWARKLSYDPLVKTVREYGESAEAELFPSRWGAVRAWARAYLYPAKSQAENDLDDDLRVRLFLRYRGAVKEIPKNRAAVLSGKSEKELEGFSGFYLALQGAPVGHSSRRSPVKIGVLEHDGRKADIIAVRHGIAYSSGIPVLKPSAKVALGIIGAAQEAGSALSSAMLASTSPLGAGMALGNLLSGSLSKVSALRRRIAAKGANADELFVMEAMRDQDWVNNLEANPVGTISAWMHRRQSMNTMWYNLRAWGVNMTQTPILTLSEYGITSFLRGTVRYGHVVGKRTYRRYLEVLHDRGWMSTNDFRMLNTIIPLTGDEVLHVAVGATQGAHQAIEEILDKIEDAGLSPLDAQVRRLFGPYGGMVVAEANNRGWDLMIALEDAARKGYAPGAIFSTVMANERERELLISSLIDDVRNPKSIAGFAANMQLYTQFLYNMMGQPNYFASPFGRILGQLTTYPISFLLHRELRPAAAVGKSAWNMAGSAVRAVKTFAGGGGRRAGGTPPPGGRTPPTGSSVAGGEPNGGKEPSDFVSRAAKVFWRQQFYSGLLLFLSGKLGLNLMIFGPPSAFIAFIGLLHVMFRNNAEFQQWFEDSMGMDTQKAFETSWRGAVWGWTRNFGFVGPTAGMLLDAPDKGWGATLRSVIGTSLMENRVETRRLVQLNYESIRSTYGEPFAVWMARVVDATYYYPSLTESQKALLHQGLLPPDQEKKARVAIFPKKSKASTGGTEREAKAPKDYVPTLSR